MFCFSEGARWSQSVTIQKAQSLSALVLQRWVRAGLNRCGTGRQASLCQRGRRQWQRRQRRREVWVNQWWVQRQGSYPQLNCGGWYRGASVVAWLVPQRVKIVKIGIRQKRWILGWLWSQPGRWWNRQPWCASAKTGLVSPSSGRWILGVGFYPAFKVICVLQTWGWEERETSASWGSFMDKSHGHSKMHLVEWNTTYEDLERDFWYRPWNLAHRDTHESGVWL